MTSLLWASPSQKLDPLHPAKSTPPPLSLEALHEWVSNDLEHALSHDSLDSEAFQLFHQHSAGLMVRRWADAALQVAYSTPQKVVPVKNVQRALREAVQEAVSGLAEDLEIDRRLVQELVDSFQKKILDSVSLGRTIAITSFARLELREEGPCFVL